MSIDYDSYLGLERLLSAQNLRSVEFLRPAHDEMLFVIVHQTYELWFKQILHELDSVLDVFKAERVGEEHMGQVVARLERIIEIQKLMIHQVTILETMTPLDFLEFRDLLYPASGFQSAQFRLIENRLGLAADKRLFYGTGCYRDALASHQQQTVSAAEQEPSLFDRVQGWLERTPFLRTGSFDFWHAYRTAVNEAFARDEAMAKESPHMNAEERQRNLDTNAQNRKLFASLLDPKAFEELREQQRIRLSHRAAQAALFIQLFRDEPVLQLPFRLLTSLMTIDEQLSTWRYRHALMAKRMLGTKMGTGGSSGAAYLQKSTEAHKIFGDFFMLTTFLLPRSQRPPLPEAVLKALRFQF
jgi:tryptophan 2,3-dioxygenase